MRRSQSLYCWIWKLFLKSGNLCNICIHACMHGNHGYQLTSHQSFDDITLNFALRIRYEMNVYFFLCLRIKSSINYLAKRLSIKHKSTSYEFNGHCLGDYLYQFYLKDFAIMYIAVSWEKPNSFTSFFICWNYESSQK